MYIIAKKETLSCEICTIYSYKERYPITITVLPRVVNYNTNLLLNLYYKVLQIVQ